MRFKEKKFITFKGAGVGGKIKVSAKQILGKQLGGAVITQASVDKILSDMDNLKLQGSSSGKGLFIPGRPLDTQLPRKGKGLLIPNRPVATQIPTGGAVAPKKRVSLNLSSSDYKATGKGLKRI